MGKTRFGLWIFVFFALSGGAIANPVCRPAELTTRFGELHSESIQIRQSAPDQPVTPKTHAGEAAFSMRLLIAAPQLGEKPWWLSIRDVKGHLVAQFKHSDFANGSTLWTGRLNGPLVTVSLRGGDSNAWAEIRRSMVTGPPNTYQNAFSISGATPTWKPLYPTSSKQKRNAGEAVGMFVGDTLTTSNDAVPGERISWCCTGVMIGRDLFLTNWHCGGSSLPWNSEVKNNAVIDLAWEGGPVRRQYSVDELVSKNERLDFAILRVRPSKGIDGSIPEAIPVDISTAPLRALQSISMIHHAQCKPKLISDKCRIQNPSRASWTEPLDGDAVPTEITHNCDTEPGASGAPIFDLQGRLIALHHLGHQKHGPHCPADNLNKAVRIGAIVDFVKENNSTLAVELGW